MKNSIMYALLINIVFATFFLKTESLHPQQQIFLNFCQNTAQHIKNLTDRDEKLNSRIDELNKIIANTMLDFERKNAEKEKLLLNEERRRSEEKIRELIKTFTVCNPYVQVSYHPAYSHYSSTYN